MSSQGCSQIPVGRRTIQCIILTQILLLKSRAAFPSPEVCGQGCQVTSWGELQPLYLADAVQRQILLPGCKGADVVAGSDRLQGGVDSSWTCSEPGSRRCSHHQHLKQAYGIQPSAAQESTQQEPLVSGGDLALSHPLSDQLS